MPDILTRLFSKLRKSRIKYTSSKLPSKRPRIKLQKPTNKLGYFKHNDYPKGLIESIKLKVSREHLKKTIKIVRSLGFIHYSNLNYYYYDSQLGLLNIGLSPKLSIPLRKPKSSLVCFVAPEGGGKTSALSYANTILQNFPVKKHVMTFSSFKPSKLHRIKDLLSKFKTVRKNSSKNVLTLSDRYIYLTFRTRKLLRKALHVVAPKPAIVFVMQASYKALKKRRGPLCSSRENVANLYKIFNQIPEKIIINTENNTEKEKTKNIQIIVNSILQLYDNKKDEHIK